MRLFAVMAVDEGVGGGPGLAVGRGVALLADCAIRERRKRHPSPLRRTVRAGRAWAKRGHADSAAIAGVADEVDVRAGGVGPVLLPLAGARVVVLRLRPENAVGAPRLVQCSLITQPSSVAVIEERPERWLLSTRKASHSPIQKSSA